MRNTIKHSFVWFVMVLPFMCSCKEENVELYSADVALNFRDYSQGSDFDFITTYKSNLSFTDKDYCDKIKEKRDSVCVILMGETLSEDRTFCVKAEAIPSDTVSAMKVVFENEGVFVMKAGAIEAWAYYTIELPTDYDVKHYTYLVLDTENPKHQFQSGRKEAMKLRAVINNKLSNLNWNPTFLGEFSNGKYRFIMDLTGETLDTYNLNYTAKSYLKREYTKYLDKGNAPILDDAGKPIVWPN